MNFDFTLRFDDEDHSLTKENGLPIEAVGEILQKLSAAISLEDSKVVLKEIRGNCYALGFTSPDERTYSNFIIVHNNIKNNDYSQLTPSEREYARTARKIIKDYDVYFEALDKDYNSQGKIRKIQKTKVPSHYHEGRVIYGQIIQVGSRSKDHPYQLVIRDFDEKMFTIRMNEALDKRLSKSLSDVYRSRFVRFEVQARISLIDEKEEYTLTGFEIPPKQSLIGSINEIQNGEKQGINFDIDQFNRIRGEV